MFILSDIDIWRQHNNISSFKFTIIIIVLINTQHPNTTHKIWFIIQFYKIIKWNLTKYKAGLSDIMAWEEPAGLHCLASLVNEARVLGDVILPPISRKVR